VTRFLTRVATVFAVSALCADALFVTVESAPADPVPVAQSTATAKSTVWTPRASVTREILLSSVADHPRAGADPDTQMPLEGANAWALRLYDIDRGSAPGHIFVLAGANVDGLGAIKVWSDTPRVPETSRASETALEGHLAAHETAEAILGRSIDLVDFTSAGGHGSSAALGQWIAYMDLATDGDFIMGIPTAATGAITSHGHLSTVTSVTAKVEAAAVAGVHVVFTTSYNGERTVLARRAPGTLDRFNLAASRGWETLTVTASDHRGANSARFGVVVVGHVGDVAAWYCGLGSRVACDISATLDVWPPLAGGTPVNWHAYADDVNGSHHATRAWCRRDQVRSRVAPLGQRRHEAERAPGRSEPRSGRESPRLPALRHRSLLAYRRQ
jgi:hypothetical protein